MFTLAFLLLASCKSPKQEITKPNILFIYQLQKISDNWKEDYNFNHPHKSLGNKSPKEYMPRFDEEFKFFIKPELNNNYLSNFKVS